MGSKLGGATALGLAAAVFVATGCGDVIDDKKIEDQLKTQVGSVGIQLKSVSCPSDVDAKAGEKIDCTVTTAKGTEVTLHGTVKSDKGLVDFNQADLQKLGATGAQEQTSP